MANWNNPLLTSLYVDFLAEVKARDVDVLTMNPGTNLPVGAKRWNVPTNTFQVWDGAVWNNLVIGAAGGGTGSTVLTLGTMAAQNSNAVAITGGTMSGVALNAGDITSGILALTRGGTGASLALGAANTFLQSNGAAVVFGVNGSALTSLNASALASGNVPIARMPVGAQQWNIAPWIQLVNGGFIVGPIADMGPGTINAQGIYINGVPVGTSAGIPSGMMAYFSGACPAGWTWVGAAGGRFIRNENGGAGAVGGDINHTHGFSVPAGGGGAINSGPAIGDQSGFASNGTNRSFDAGSSFSGYLTNASSHNHTIGHDHNFNVPGFPGHNGTSDPGGNWPPYIEFSLCSKN
jgi:hypothetical protein